ncbi:MAG TPA: hypothetical protein PK858_00940, partial [Saprospiraceae bacterium]|nr:hypothetical protein [Saprospiraceae bacterium]
LKVCMVVPGALTCCRTLEYQGPTCGNQNCEIYNLKIEPGTCTSDSTYKAVIRFDVFNPPSTKFAVVVNGVNLGIYDLSQLPLTLNNLPSNGASTDVLKVCMVVPGALTCCRTLEYQGPICGNQNCEIYNLTAQVGDCTSDSTYKLTLNFQVNNPGNSLFEVWAGGTKYLGAFPLSQLPLVIPNYPEGNAYHFVKVCINDHPNCCRTVQFVGRNCGAACEITNLSVVTGLCTGDSTYKVTINFGVNNPLTDMFSVVGNGHFLGFYKLGQLPLTLEFPWNGGNFDLIEVCAVTAPGIACCKKIEFAVPDCILHPVCEIYDLTVQTGDCTSDSSYQAKVNFKVTGSSAQTFTLWANGQVLGTYNLSQLPLAIQNFPWNGGLFDAVKVCMNNPDPAAPPCCRTKEFAVPNCLSQCDIVDLEMLVGDCTSDSTYKVKINFQVIGSSSNVFGVWVNGQNIGFYNLSQLPLTLTVHSDGGLTDAIKVCLMGNNMGQVLCCRTQEVEVPGCIDMNCHIWDVQVLKTPCLCGKFFAIVSFQHQHGGAGGFDIMGNGQNYGNFPYSATQPIILGPLMGDGTTPYEFVVKDHLHPDCRDFAVLGKVECSTPTDELAGSSGHMLLSPNPAKDRLNVTAQLDGKALVGSAQVEVRHADGRLLQTLSVAEGSNFSLDVSTLPAGVYRLTLMADGGRLEASFVKAD